MNELQVGIDEVGRIHLSRAGYCKGIYTLETTEALRAFFQAERDQELGWWRDPENPNTVVYPRYEQDDHDGRCILLLNETTGDTGFEWERLATSGPALRYFAAHADVEPDKPRHDAKAGVRTGACGAGMHDYCPANHTPQSCACTCHQEDQ